ncbi:hypothetical protein [Bradyrhizobium sp. 199]|uniref:hypothetical protein n=1 Tax=Bradyrhizobium sp. 199 TaxID=2782664 RepID=UPI001FF9DC34|nr:hypothetical protein [Bradyrhizobium sp. 199]MCK1357350.1 hypothetical protein [Bradyrhizobium sp. 199]
MTKVPNVEDYSLEVREEVSKEDDLALRTKEAEQRALMLRDRLQEGPSKEERAADAERAVKGEPLADLDSEFKTALREFRALEDALKAQKAKVVAVRREAGGKMCDELVVPLYAKAEKRLASLLFDLYTQHCEIFRLKRGLLNQGLGTYGVFRLEPEFLGVPNGTSDFEIFLRECVKAGLLRSLPMEFPQ